MKTPPPIGNRLLKNKQEQRPADFDGDPFPEAPRILFIGAAESSHTRAWIDALSGGEFNLRLFALPTGMPPADWQVRTYVTTPLAPELDPAWRVGLYPPAGPREPGPQDPVGGDPEIPAIEEPGSERGFTEKCKDKLLTDRIEKYQKAQEGHRLAQESYNQAKLAYKAIEQEYNEYKQTCEVNKKWLISAMHGWKQQVYAAQPPANLINPGWRADFSSLGREELWLPYNQFLDCYLPFQVYGSNEDEETWLAEIIKSWRPDIIHTVGLTLGGYFYYPVRRRHGLEDIGAWVMQTRGGSDLTLSRLDPDSAPVMRTVMSECDQIITDNEMNFAYLNELGIGRKKICPLGWVPGTGGIDVSHLSRTWSPPSSRQRVILWPKAYESPWSKALPVLEAIEQAWEKIRPCEIHLLASDSEVQMHCRALPEEIQKNLQFYERIDRDKVFELMGRARVMLAPSLVDGVPNTLYEAMAIGAFPILSPIDTITTVAKEPDNVLFAHNLYPQEMAGALIKAMNEDDLVDKAAERNLEMVKQIADRAVIAPKLQAFYRNLAQKGRGSV